MSTLCADVMVLNFFWWKETFKKYLLASVRTITNSKDFLFWLSFAATCHSQLSEHNSKPQAAFGSTSEVTGGHQKAGTSFGKRSYSWKCFQNLSVIS